MVFTTTHTQATLSIFLKGLSTLHQNTFSVDETLLSVETIYTMSGASTQHKDQAIHRISWVVIKPFTSLSFTTMKALIISKNNYATPLRKAIALYSNDNSIEKQYRT